jgi:hypothetical protein
VVDETALSEALAQGRIAGAALDVFAEEPLPEASPLWSMPNVIVTPHVSGFGPRFWERTCEMFAGNLRRWLAGEPLENVVDKGRGIDVECEHLGIVLAGGAGTRLGLGVPKALVRLGGMTLLERAARNARRGVRSRRHHGPKGLDFPLPDLGSATAVTRAFDPQGSAGPGAGVMAGLMDQDFQDALVLAVDFPFMTTGALRGIPRVAGLIRSGGARSAGNHPAACRGLRSRNSHAPLPDSATAGTFFDRALGRFNVRHLDDAFNAACLAASTTSST